ncbi:hypothetical protein Droror1_Dr00018863 [Drosera rotundifolia]
MHRQRPTPTSSIHLKANLKAAALAQSAKEEQQDESNKEPTKTNSKTITSTSAKDSRRIGQRKSMQLLLVEYSAHLSKIFKQEANDTIKVATRRQGNFINHQRRQIRASIRRSTPQPLENNQRIQPRSRSSRR